MVTNLSSPWTPMTDRASPSIRPARSALRRGLVVLNIGLLSVIILQVGFYTWLAPRLVLDYVLIQGTARPQALIEYLGLKKGTPFYLLDENQIQERLMALPEIRSASVLKRFPDSLTIVVDQRQPVGIVLHPESLEVFLIDREGVVFPKQSDARLDYLLISGLFWDEGSTSPRLDPRYVSFLEDLYQVKAQEPGIYDLISEVKIELSQTGFTLKIAFVHSRVPVLFSRPLTVDNLKQALLLLDLIRTESWEQEVLELDMRTAAPVFRKGVRS